jgi:hypothetical protein
VPAKQRKTREALVKYDEARLERCRPCDYARRIPWQHIRISQFGGSEVLKMEERPTVHEHGPGEVRIKVLAAGTGFTDTARSREPGACSHRHMRITGLSFLSSW